MRLLVVVFLCAAIFGGYFFFQWGMDRDAEQNIPSTTITTEDVTPADNSDENTVEEEVPSTLEEAINSVEEGTEFGGLSDEEFFQLETPEDFSFGGANLELFYNAFMNNKSFFCQDEELYFDVFRAYLFAETSANQEVNELVKCWDGEAYTLNWELQQLCEGEDVYVQDADSNFFHERDAFRSFKKVMQWEDFSCDYFLTKKYDYPERDAVKNKVFDYFSCKAIENDSFDLKREYFLFGVAMDQEKCDIFDDKNLSAICKDFSVILEEDTLSTDDNS